jgi:dihydroxy-acid dehydratase
MTALGAEVAALRFGTGFTRDDFDKPLVVVEAAAGEGHPGARHLGLVAGAVRETLFAAGLRPLDYRCTGVCDGLARGTPAAALAFASREALALSAEAHATCAHADGVLFISSCGPAAGAHLMAAARLNLPTAFVPGGVMSPSDDCHTLEYAATLAREAARAPVPGGERRHFDEVAAPGPGCCAYLGAAATIQLMLEALGVAPPASALIPAGDLALVRAAKEAGALVGEALNRGVRFRDVVDERSLHNALAVHAAVGGSTDALLHLAALAAELGLPFDLAYYNRLADNVPLVANVRPGGEHPAAFLWYAGGAAAVMHEVRDWLRLGAMTVTGATVRKNLDDLERRGFFARNPRRLACFRLSREDVIRRARRPLARRAAARAVFGNVAPAGALALAGATARFRGRARIFFDEGEAREAVEAGRVRAGTVLVLPFMGPRGAGMPALADVIGALAAHPRLGAEAALVTDGRLAGATGGVCVGHVSPEAAAAGPLAAVRDGDIISVNVAAGKVDLVETAGGARGSGVAAAMERRLAEMPPFAPGRRSGLLALYTKLAGPPERGARMEW